MTGQRCIGHHPNVEPDDRPEADTGLLCGRCFSRLRNQLLELPAVATWLHVNLAAGGAAGERVSGTREDPMPLRSDVLDLIGPASIRYVPPAVSPRFVVWEDGDLLADCESWQQAEAHCREAMRDAGLTDHVIAVALGQSITRQQLDDDPDLEQIVEQARTARDRWQIRPTDRGGSDQRGEDAITAALRHWCSVCVEENPAFAWTGWNERNTLTGLVGWLAARLSWIAGREWVDELASELRSMTSQAHRVAPWREETRLDRDPCPSCQVRAVVLHIGEGKSRCERRMGGCGRVQPLSEYVLNAVLPATRRAG